jgi:hypothetical protein
MESLFIEPWQTEKPYCRKPRIGIVANEAHHGLVFQRGHIMLRHLRHRYDFVIMNQAEIEKCAPLYLDAIIVFHPYNAPNELLIHRCKMQYQIPVIVDVDDYISNLTSDHPGFMAFKNNKVVSCIMAADHFVTSTDYLKQVYGDLNENISVIENVVDPARYHGIDHQTKPYHSGFIVGWTGGQTHLGDLHNTGFVAGLADAMRENDDIRAHFHILCPQKLIDEFGARVSYNPDPVDFLDYPSLCFTFPWDLCAVPLHDAPFNDAKSDLRLLDMAPFKIPVLASPRHEFIRHSRLERFDAGVSKENQRILLVKEDTRDEWARSILNAAADRKECRRIGDNVHQYVMEHRTAKQGAEKWDRVLTEVLLRHESRSKLASPQHDSPQPA